jgi:hypothetical protein
MSPPRHEPVVLITSAPPGSLSSQKRKSREEPQDALSTFTLPKEGPFGNRRAAQRRRTMYVCKSWLPGHILFLLDSD